MARIEPSLEAYPLRQRQPRIRNEKYLDQIRSLPCVICGDQAEAAHVRASNARVGKFESGMQAKPDDCWTVPLCPGHHRLYPESQHSVGEQKFWGHWGIDPFLLALSLWRAKDSPELMYRIVRENMNGTTP